MSGPSGERSVILIGGHDTGKSFYVGRLWLALRRGDGLLAMPEDPEHIEYVEELIRSIEQGKYPQRTDNDGEARDFCGGAVIRGGRDDGATVQIEVPDVAGELWERACEDRQIELAWIERIRSCAGALVFVRFGSKHFVKPLNWVTDADTMKLPIARLIKADRVATQIFLTDMLNLLEQNLGKALSLARPRVAILAAAWDALPQEVREAGPLAYVESEFPMFGGRLRDRGRLETMAFGTSITGGDLNTQAHREAFLKSNADEEGYVVYRSEDGELIECKDLTLPVAWALGIETN
jgi:hypothetical protein